MSSATVLPAETPGDQPAATAHEYLRVSVDKSGRERSQDDQHTENQTARRAHGWQEGRSYRDTGSASKHARKSRANFDRLLADLRPGGPFAPGDVLILWESSRGSRRQAEWATLLDLVEDNRMRVFVTSHGRLYDPANPRDRRSLDEDGVDSAYESGKTSVRLRRAAAAAAAAGRPHGRWLYGYERVHNPATKELVEQRPKYPQADVVRQVITDVARGVSLRAIVADLNARNMPTATGAAWGSNTVRSLATNMAYIGKRVHHPGRRGTNKRGPDAVISDGNWPPLVDEVTFWAAQRILSDPTRRTSRPGKVKHLLSLIAVCGHCGGPMTVTYRKYNNRAGSYACRDRNCAVINKDDLDEWITAEVLAYLAEPDVWERWTAGAAEDKVLLAARARLDALTADLQETYQRAALWPRPGGISAAGLAAVEPGKLAGVAEAEKRIAELNTPAALRALLDTDGDLAARWEAAPITARRDVIRMLATIRVVRSPKAGQRVSPAQRCAIEWNDPSR